MFRRMAAFFVALGLVISAAQAKETTARDRFLEHASKINTEAATLFAEGLTDADWVEMKTDNLIESFQAALDARTRFPWGTSYSDDIYRQYVLPLRVDDEPLQPYRKYFLDEIGSRLDTIKTLSQAALEVNLWLGERIGFQPTDWRDQGPLTTLSCGFGRCGEMMILAIDAMRSVGIPTRGVYVPFWSASDNNHAWIEVYTENGWKYMGACEPAPRLNQAWFDKSVLRAAVLLTKDRSHDATHPDAVKTGNGYALNVTRNYVPPAKLVIEMPQDWAKDDIAYFALFNFGTIRPILELVPENGIAALEVGHGDFMLMGRYKGALFVQPISAQVNRETRVVLATEAIDNRNFTLTYPWPPVKKEAGDAALPQWRIDMAGVERHERDAKRSWTSEWLNRFIKEQGETYERLFDILAHAPGNADVIMNAVLDLPEDKRENAIFILDQLSAKDLRDVKREQLDLWLVRDPGTYTDEALKAALLSPKVAYEYPGTGVLTDYATESIAYEDLKELRKDVKRYAKLMGGEIRNRPLPPLTIDHLLASKTKVSKRSGAIWWVDRLRRAGIPARKDPWAEWLEFHWESEWLPLLPDEPKKLADMNALPDIEAHYQTPATITVSWTDGGSAPAYESEICFVPINDEGWPNYRKEYPEDLQQTDSTTVLKIIPGTYLVTAGRRNARGDVHVKTDIMEVTDEQTLNYVIDLLPPPEPPAVNALEVAMSDLEWTPARDDCKHLLIIIGDNEPSKRTRLLAEPFDGAEIEVTFSNGLGNVSEADRNTLGLAELDETLSPFVFFFDEEGRLLFTQSGYDLNLPSKLRNANRR